MAASDVWFELTFHTFNNIDDRCGVVGILITQEVTDSIPAQCKHLYVHVLLYWVWVILYVCIYKKNVYKYILIRYP
jgi:hypothetical protein